MLAPARGSSEIITVQVRDLQKSGRRGLKGNLCKRCINMDLQKHSGTVRIAIQLSGPRIKKSE